MIYLKKRELYEFTSEERKMLFQYGYCVHAVSCGHINTNYHTHGLPEMKNHIDLQITLNIQPQEVFDIFHLLIAEINKGKTFTKDSSIKYLNKPLKLMETFESGRQVLRIMLPDSNGKFPEDENCNFEYALQNLECDEIQ